MVSMHVLSSSRHIKLQRMRISTSPCEGNVSTDDPRTAQTDGGSGGRVTNTEKCHNDIYGGLSTVECLHEGSVAVDPGQVTSESDIVYNTVIKNSTSIIKVDSVFAGRDINIILKHELFDSPCFFWSCILIVIVTVVMAMFLRYSLHDRDREHKNQLASHISERTMQRINLWTNGMVNTSALDKVMDKLQEGITWISIIGSPGEGKTTTAYMALEHLHRSGRQVFHVFTPGEFTEVIRTYSQPVIMLDDIFGDREFDLVAWTMWKPVLHEILDLREHRSHLQIEDTGQVVEPIVIFIGRYYILHAARVHMGRLHDFIVQDMSVVDMSHRVERPHKEKKMIWKAIVESERIMLDEDKIDSILATKGNHGFPDVCRLFVKMYKNNPDIDEEAFFKRPLQFLSDTVELFLEDDIKRTLFTEMIHWGGNVSQRELERVDSSYKVIKVAKDLNGTYIRFEDGYFKFDHPSIYDSVASNLCKYYEYCHGSSVIEIR